MNEIMNVKKWRCLICKSKCFNFKIDTLFFIILMATKELNLNINEVIFDENANIDN